MGLDITSITTVDILSNVREIGYYKEDINKMIYEISDPEELKKIALDKNSYNREALAEWIKKYEREDICTKKDNEDVIDEEKLNTAVDKNIDYYVGYAKECFKYYDIINNANIEEIAREYEPKIEKYQSLLDDDKLYNSRLGSYSTIHYLRMFAENLGLYLKNKNIDPMDCGEERLSDEEVKRLVQMSVPNITAYRGEIYHNLCYHSDCDDYYFPIKERRVTK